MASTSALTLTFAAATDVGRLRANNEDSYGFELDHHLYVVCDGIGGSAGGEVASELAVQTLIESFKALHPAAQDTQALAIEHRMIQSIHHANATIRQTGKVNPPTLWNGDHARLRLPRRLTPMAG